MTWIFFFIFKPNLFGWSWSVQAHQNQKPNQTKHFPKYLNRFNWFFFTGSVFSVNFFFNFLGFSVFVLTPIMSLQKTLFWLLLNVARSI